MQVDIITAPVFSETVLIEALETIVSRKVLILEFVTFKGFREYCCSRFFLPSPDLRHQRESQCTFLEKYLQKVRLPLRRHFSQRFY